MTDDIVERLRNYARNLSVGPSNPPEDYLTWQAADEIERLRAALQQIANMGTGERVRIARRALEPKP